MTVTQTSPDPGKETRLVDVKGRQVVVRRLTDAQYILMAREAKMLKRSDIGGERKMDATSRIFEILESGIVQDDDREYVVNLVAAGKVEISDLLALATVFATATETEVDDKPKVRRGRPPRAVAR